MNRTLLGMLTPSSNTVLEPVTAAMLAGLPGVSAHFGRFAVTEIALSDAALAQFQIEAPMAAARLLAHARCGVIAWSGTSAGWLGTARDTQLCSAIEAETGARAATSVLATLELLRRFGARRIGLVTPYTRDVQDAIAANWRGEGLEVVAERHLDLRDNFAFSEVDEDRIETLVREVAKARPDAIVILCTNLRGARVAARVEGDLGVTVVDSVAAVVWKSLGLAGVDPRQVRGWGRLFGESAS